MPSLARRTSTDRTPAAPLWARTCYGIITAGLLALLVLHAPWSGYTTHVMPENVDTMTLLARCPELVSKASTADTTQAQLLAQAAANDACASRVTPIPIPIKPTRWRSRAPAFHMFGRLRNVLAAGMVLALAAGAVALVVRRARR